MRFTLGPECPLGCSTTAEPTIDDPDHDGQLRRLPGGCGLVEQRAGPRNRMSWRSRSAKRHLGEELDGGIAISPPVTRIVRRTTTNESYAEAANRIVVKHHLGRIKRDRNRLAWKQGQPGCPPRRKDGRPPPQRHSRADRRDLFPPTQRDPYGIHKAIWDEIVEEDFTFPDGKDLCSGLHTRPAAHARPTSSR